MNAIFKTADQQLIPLNSYDEISDFGRFKNSEEFNKRNITVVKNGKKGVLNSNYQELVAPQYEMFNYVDELIHVNKDGKFGFLDRNFKVVIPIEYDYAEYVNGSRFLVLKNGEFYCIDRQEKKQICNSLEPKWKKVHYGFTIENYQGVELGDHLGVINTSTYKMILPIKYEKRKTITSVFFEKFIKKNEAIFNQKNFIFSEKPDIYDEILFSDNKILVKNLDNLYGVIDTTFNTIIDFKYEKLEIYPKKPEYLIYSKNKKVGVMNLSEEEIVPSKYDELRQERDRLLFQVRQKDEWGIVDIKGELLIACQYDSIKFLGHWDRPKENLWVVNKGEKYGVINEENEILVPFIYHGISHLHSNNLWVMDKDNKRYKVNFRDQRSNITD